MALRVTTLLVTASDGIATHSIAETRKKKKTQKHLCKTASVVVRVHRFFISLPGNKHFQEEEKVVFANRLKVQV